MIPILLTALVGLLIGVLVASGGIFATRLWLQKRLKSALEHLLLTSMQSKPMPDALKATTRGCMKETVEGFRQKMPLISAFITPQLVLSMEEMMLEKLQKNWPLLLESLNPALSQEIVTQALYHPTVLRLIVGYSATLGFLIGLLLAILRIVIAS